MLVICIVAVAVRRQLWSSPLDWRRRAADAASESGHGDGDDGDHYARGDHGTRVTNTEQRQRFHGRATSTNDDRHKSYTQRTGALLFVIYLVYTIPVQSCQL